MDDYLNWMCHDVAATHIKNQIPVAEVLKLFYGRNLAPNLARYLCPHLSNVCMLA